VDRDTHGRFAKGNASNGGRPKGLAERCRAAVHDGADIVTLMLEIMQGQHEAKTADRISAAEWFSDRGWGKAVQTIDATVTSLVKEYSGVEIDQV